MFTHNLVYITHILFVYPHFCIYNTLSCILTSYNKHTNVDPQCMPTSPGYHIYSSMLNSSLSQISSLFLSLCFLFDRCNEYDNPYSAHGCSRTSDYSLLYDIWLSTIWWLPHGCYPAVFRQQESHPSCTCIWMWQWQ